MGRHVVGDDGSGTYHGVLAHVPATDDGAVGSQRCAAPDARLAKLALALDKSARIDDVGEYHRGATEHVVLQGDALVDGDVVLYFAAVANLHVAIYVYVLPDIAARSDARAGHDVAEMPYGRLFADVYGWIDLGRFVDKIRVRHVYSVRFKYSVYSALLNIRADTGRIQYETGHI